MQSSKLREKEGGSSSEGGGVISTPRQRSPWKKRWKAGRRKTKQLEPCSVGIMVSFIRSRPQPLHHPARWEAQVKNSNRLAFREYPPRKMPKLLHQSHNKTTKTPTKTCLPLSIQPSSCSYNNKKDRSHPKRHPIPKKHLPVGNIEVPTPAR